MRPVFYFSRSTRLQIFFRAVFSAEQIRKYIHHNKSYWFLWLLCTCTYHIHVHLQLYWRISLSSLPSFIYLNYQQCIRLYCVIIMHSNSHLVSYLEQYFHESWCFYNFLIDYLLYDRWWYFWVLLSLFPPLFFSLRLVLSFSR